MTTTIAVTFPHGQYHANPWGRNVNEAAADWPPSPWRILRALVATWKTRAPELPDAAVLPMLEALAGPPAYALPRHRDGHTRHFMPDTAHGKDKVFDPFLAVHPQEPLFIRWPAELADVQRQVLAQLAGLLPYLGRGESVCTATLMDGPPSAERWIEPLDDATPDWDHRVVRLLSARQPLDWASLVATTPQVRKAGSITPAGAQWIEYPLPSSEPAVRFSHEKRDGGPDRVLCIRFALGRPTPSMHLAVAVADRVRRAALSQWQRLFAGQRSALLEGKQDEERLVDNHRHAHWLCIPADNNRLIGTVVAYAEERFGPREVAALSAIRELTPSRQLDLPSLAVAVEALGSPSEAAPEVVSEHGTTRWRSVTPFAPNLHRKRGQSPEGFLESAVARELAWRGLPALEITPELIPGDWLAYRRHRVTEKLRDARPARGLRVVLREPVPGPLTLGALTHFGLGLFAPDSE